MPAASTPAVRAGDSDREKTAALLGQALAEGYLDMAEYETRLQTAFTAPTQADLRRLTADLPVERLRHSDPRRHAAQARAARRSVQFHVAAYLTMVVIVLTVWLAVGLTAGAWYFWPVWPILGAGIGVLGHALPVNYMSQNPHHGCAGGQLAAMAHRSALNRAGRYGL